MNKNEARPHISVMRDEFLKYFEGCKLNVFFEGTLGAGGHAYAILEAHPEIKKYLACDRDPQAIELASSFLEPWKKKIDFINGNFADLDAFLDERGIKVVDGFFLISEFRLCN